MKTSQVLTLAGAVMAMVLVDNSAYAQAEKRPEGSPVAANGAMKPFKNGVEARINRLSQQLHLTAEQQAAIKPILEDEETRRKEIRADTGQNVAEHRAKLQELRESTLSRIRPILTPEQQRLHDAQSEQIRQRHQKRISSSPVRKEVK